MSDVSLFGCIEPTGDFEENCRVQSYQEYTSSDNEVPTICRMEANCEMFVNDYEGKDNVVFLPIATHIKDLVNYNGELTYEGKPLRTNSVLKVGDNSFKCPPLAGSYQKSCTTKFASYYSSDEELRYTELCKAELSCRTLYSDNIDSTIVYFNIKDKLATVQSLENCDGKLVIGGGVDLCNIGDTKRIIETAKNGRTGTIKLT